MEEVRPKTPFLIQLSNLADCEILLPKGTNIGICNATVNEQYVFVVELDLARNQSTNKEDLAALHLMKKAEKRVKPSVTAEALVLPKNDNEKGR